MIGFSNANLWGNSFYNQQGYSSLASYAPNSYFNSFLGSFITELFPSFLNNSMLSQMSRSFPQVSNNNFFNPTNFNLNIINNFSVNNQPTGFNNIFNLIQIINIFNNLQPKEPEEVFIVGGVGHGKTLGDNIAQFAGNSNRGDKTNNKILDELLKKLSEEDKKLLNVNKTAYIISESGKIIGSFEDNDLNKVIGTDGSQKQELSNFKIIENLKGDSQTNTSEEMTGGKIIYNGVEYDVNTTIIRRGSPLILDLKGNGIELTSYKDGVNFDLDADGKIDRTGWTQAGSDDAFLVLDKDGNGQIDSGKELFGDQNGEENGFLELAKYDSNNDGKIDAQDDVYEKLQTWTDTNHNGKVDDGELKSLLESNVKSVSTGYNIEYDENGNIKTDRHGNLVGHVGQFEKLDGTINRMIDAFFRFV